MTTAPSPSTTVDLSEYLPAELQCLENPRTALPAIAKVPRLLQLIEAAVQEVPTHHALHLGDARRMQAVAPESVHLVLTSSEPRPPREACLAQPQLRPMENLERK